MKLYVWGTGVILGRVMDYRVKLDDVIAFVDNKPKQNTYMGKPVIKPEGIGGEYDAIIIANSYALEISEQCKALDNIDESKCIYLYNNYLLDDLNKDYKFVESIFGKNYAKLVKGKYHLIRSVARDEVKKTGFEFFENDKMFKEDYVRVRILALCIDEIKRKNVSGSIAELGVYQGNFAKYLNYAFPDRLLYLLDTFEGFVEGEANREKADGNVNESFIQAVKNTSVELVKSKMQTPDQIRVIKGMFPESLKGIELDNQFAFVSLDVDFEESTLAGLEYFYPRLSTGGYIFIHDYNYGYYDSVIKAIDRYEEKYEVSLPKVPLCDADGTLVITK